jgi:hypothetical protein
MILNSFPLLSLCSAFVGLASGFHLEFRRDAPHSTSVNFTGPDPFQFSNVNGGDNRDIYVGTVIVGGQSFEVQLDTGSSDLWLDTAGTSTDGFKDTGVTGSITYGDQTSATGPILIGNVTFGTFTVAQQAFISAPGSNATTSGDKGLLGVGPPGLSNNLKSLSGTSYNGNSFLDNVFSIYPQDPNFITFSLSRSGLGVTAGGTFTIASIPDQFSAATNAASLPVVNPTSDEPQWVCNLDDLIIQGQDTKSSGTALLDTGTSLSSAPASVVDAIYGSITGAEVTDGEYVVPCDSKIDISFVFGGVTYPVHPIDLTFVQESNGTVQCIGAFSYNDPASSGVDYILGDSFLRNVFSVYDFGYWTTVGETAPFVKLLSVTDATKADSEFDSLNQARISQAQAAAQNSTGSSDSGSAAQNTTASTDGKDTKAGSLASSDSSVDLSGLTRNTYIIMGLLGGVIFMLLVLSALTVMTKNNKGYRAVTTGAAPAPYHSQYARTSMDDKYRDT